MKKPISKILLFLVTYFSLSLSLYAIPEDNSILRLQSKNSDGDVVYAVVVGDDVKALTANDEDYNIANSLWIVKVNRDGETFTLQNVGTNMYLYYASKQGTSGSQNHAIYYLKPNSNSAINLYEEEKGYCCDVNKIKEAYIQYDPLYNEWRYYSDGVKGHNPKEESQTEAENLGKFWDDTTNPPSNEEESVKIPGSELGDVLDGEDVNLDKLKENIDKVVDRVEYNDASKSPSTPIVVGTKSTYPTSSYWKQSTIKVTVNSSTWTPVSFPMNVKCVTSGISDVYVQTYSTEKRSNGVKAWENKLLTSSDVLKRGVAYNLATDETSEIILEFEVVATEGVTIKNEVVSVVDDYSHNLEETTVNGLNRDKNWYYIGNALFLEAKMNNAIDYACQYNGSSYVPVDLEGESFAPFSTFFVQYAGDYTMSSAKATINSAPMLAKEKSLTEKYSLRIDGENSYYKTGIYFAGGASAEDYVVGEDFLSFATKKGKGVEIYTVEDDADYSFNKRPIENTVVRVGMYVGTAGRYTISLDNISGNAESMILYDTYEQDFARLHLGETYTFDSEKGSFDDRFAVAVTYAPEVPTDNISLSANKLIVVNNEIQGLTLDSELVVYDAMGHLVYVANVDSETMILPNLNSGIYIACNGNGWAKFLVK